MLERPTGWPATPPTSDPCCRPRTSAPSPQAVSTASTTACCRGSDVHALFDRGYLAVDPRHRLLVSPKLRDDFGNGEAFYARAGHPITLPRRMVDRPARAALEWHLDEVFQRS